MTLDELGDRRRRPSSCSPRHEKHCSGWHAWCVTEYRAARTAAELAHDIAYGGTRTEDREHRGELITFKTWLIGLKGGTEDGLSRAAS